MVRISLLLGVWTFKATGFELNKGFVNKVIFQKPYFEKKLILFSQKATATKADFVPQTFYLGIHTEYCWLRFEKME